MEKESSKEKILQAAEKLFAEKGFNGVGIREITAAAAVNSSAVSYYFDGKYGLYCAVIASKVRMFAEALKDENIRRMQAKDIICLYAETVIKIHRKYPYFVRLLYHELLTPTDALRSFAEGALQPVLQSLRYALQKGRQEGCFSNNIDSDKAIMMLAGALNFYFLARPIHQQVIVQNDVFSEQYVHQVLEIFFRGISEVDEDEKV